MSQKVGFTCGTFDLCHPGHLLMFEECKKHCDYLIVGLATDPTIENSTKNKPIESMFERFTRLKACKYIDEIIVYENPSDLRAILNKLYIEHGQNLIRFMDETYKSRRIIEIDLPIKIHFNSRRNAYASSNLRRKIYEMESKKQEELGGVGWIYYHPENKKILLHERDDRIIGRWDYFGGGVEEDEDIPEKVLERELREELGTSLTKAFLLRDYWVQDGRKYIFYILYNNEKFQLKEGKSMKWFTFKEALNLELSQDTRENLLLLRERLLK